MTASATAPVTGAQALSRRLGLWRTTLSGIGIILGAGIYVLIGRAAGDAGGVVWSSFVIAGVLAGATGLSYAELAAMFPEAGGSSSYVREAFGRRAGFTVGWLVETMAVLAAAAVAIGFGGYAERLLDAPPVPSALVLLVAAGVVVWIGVRETVAVAVACTLIEVAGLLLAITVGLPYLSATALTDAPYGLSGVLAGASLVFFAFTGFEQMVTLTEETHRPTWTIPRAMLLAIAACTALYLLVAVTAVSVLPWRDLAESDAPLAAVVGAATGGAHFDRALSVIALFATGNTVLLLLATGARLAWGMARRHLLPPPFLLLDPHRRTPWFATAAVTAAAAGFALSGDIERVAHITNVTLFAAFIAVNAAVIRLRFDRPGAVRPFRLAGVVRGVPVVSAIGGIAAAVLLARVEPLALLGGLGVTACGVALSFAALPREVAARLDDPDDRDDRDD